MTVTTVASIAARLGISRTTVSNAFSRPDQLSSHLRQEILCAAQALGYPGPDPLAQSLRRGNSSYVALLFGEELATSLLTSAAQRLLASVAAASEQHWGGLLLASAAACRPRRAAGPTGRASQPTAGGLIAYSVPEQATGGFVRSPGKRVLIGGPPPTNPEIAWVQFDLALGAHALGRHLVELGHRSVHMVRTPVFSASFGWPEPAEAMGEHIFDGFSQGLGAALSHTYDLCAVPTRKQCVELLGTAENATAIACDNDATALALHAIAKQLGIKIPEQLSIVGVGDVPAARLAGLTTISEPCASAGHTALALLAEGGRCVLPAEVMMRDSTGPAHSR
ncbi:MAG: LacI family DNA-binding transcriptional regulator [Corynebacteriales bacterium]|nr:LacI family DNA-binding transcriptional regulator [Mycobacteriales bacterium]